MLKNEKSVFAVLAVVSAAAVTVLSIGGYILHKKTVKRRLQEFARRQAMNLAMFDYNGNGDDDYYDDDYEDGDYTDKLFEEFDEDGFFKEKTDK
jgi:hypothetical protein